MHSASKNEIKGRLGAQKDKADVAIIFETHRHRYEVNNDYIEDLEKQGLKFVGKHITVSGKTLCEIIELEGNRWHVGSQFHPEFRASLEQGAPLFRGFIKAAKERKLEIEGNNEENT